MTPEEFKTTMLGQYEAYKEFLLISTDAAYGDAELVVAYSGLKTIKIKPNLEGFMKWIAFTLTPPPAE